MKSIYTKASNVVIWLGESEEGIDVAIQQIPEILPLADDYSGAKDGFEDALKRYGIPIRGGLFGKELRLCCQNPGSQDYGRFKKQFCRRMSRSGVAVMS